MAGAQSRSSSITRTYRIISSDGQKAALARITEFEKQHRIIGKKNPDAARIYKGVIVALKIIRAANDEGVQHGALLLRLQEGSGGRSFTPPQLEEIVRIVRGHMDAIVRIDAAQRGTATDPGATNVKSPRARKKAATTVPEKGARHSPARERLEQSKLR